MNYLSHFYVFQQGDNPMYSLGLVFPDLTRGYVKLPGKRADADYSGHEWLVQGCLAHYQADKHFHGSAFFHWGTAICIEKLKHAVFETEVNRRWFLGHILFELLLDRILVNHQNKVCADFYQQLNQLDTHEIRRFIELHEHGDVDRFFRFFEHFRRAAYIRNYPDNNLFAFSLSRIALRAGMPPLSMADQVVLWECVQQLEEREFRKVQSVLLELKMVFA